MKICMLDPLFAPYFGGSEKVVYEVSKRLVKRGFEITVLTSQIPGTKREDELEGIKIRRLPCLYLEHLPPPLPPPYSIAPTLNLELRKLADHDVFHIHNRFWYGFGTLANIKLLMRKKLAITIHNARPHGIDFLTDTGAGLYDDIFTRWWYYSADLITCVSRYTCRVTIPGRALPKSRVIYNGVDTGRFSPAVKPGDVRERFGIPENAPLLLCNARLVSQKGLDDLLAAFTLVKRAPELRDARLLLIGKGPLKEALLGFAAKLGVADSFSITTGIPENELPRFYAACDAFVLPSRYEPGAVVLYEAMATGKPVIATRVGGNEEIVGDSGLLVNSRDPVGMSGAIQRALTDSKLKSELSAKARKRAVENFDWDIVAGKYAEAYESLQR